MYDQHLEMAAMQTEASGSAASGSAPSNLRKAGSREYLVVISTHRWEHIDCDWPRRDHVTYFVAGFWIE